METSSDAPQGQRDLLGLRPPAQLAEDGPTVGPRPGGAAEPRPARPDYPVISSGWAEEDTGPNKTSDLMTAVRAGLILLAVMIGIGLLIG